MKIFVEKHEAVIDGWFKPQVEKAKQGDVVPHRKQVTKVYLYQREFINDQEVYRKVELSKEMILELSDKIQDIESQVVEMPFDELPF
jgi:hypothetical protein